VGLHPGILAPSARATRDTIRTVDAEEGRNQLEGRLGRVTVAIPPGGAGEVMIESRDGPGRYPAWSDRPLSRHTPVEVRKVRDDGSVDVVAFGSAP
jgi:hypothetical protein